MARMDENAIKDVRKKINEVMNKQEQKLTFGWRPQQVERKEGEEWTDVDGKRWIKKNGLIQSVSKLDGFKTPWWCPKCETPLNGHHLIAYKKVGKCHDCMLKEEMELKQSGKWVETVIEKGRQNHMAAVRDRIQQLQDAHDFMSQPEFIHADNEKILMVEKWDVDLDTVKKDLMEEINKLKEHLVKVEAGEFDETQGKKILRTNEISSGNSVGSNSVD